MKDLVIPENLITSKKEDSIDFNCVIGKTIIGLCGYSKSGKDYTAKYMSKIYGFNRISFGDTLKKVMNETFREQTLKSLREDGVDINLEDIDFNVDQGEIKEALRPYMIWFAEKVKEINGKQFWVNETLRQAKDYNKIVISDIRRLNELELFKNSNSIKKLRNTIISGIGDLELEENGHDFYLWKINKLSNRDADLLTVEAIKFAHENWYFSDEIRIDPYISKSHRKLAIDFQIKEKLLKHKIDF